MNLGKTVKRLRSDKGWSQTELARRIGGGVKPQSIQQLEEGIVEWPRYLIELAAAFGMSVEELVKGPQPVYDRIALKQALEALASQWEKQAGHEFVGAQRAFAAGDDIDGRGIEYGAKITSINAHELRKLIGQFF